MLGPNLWAVVLAGRRAMQMPSTVKVDVTLSRWKMKSKIGGDEQRWFLSHPGQALGPWS